MGYIKNEEIRGYQSGRSPRPRRGLRFSVLRSWFLPLEDGTIVCPKCMAPEDLKDVTEDEILTDKEVDDIEGTYYCDRCKKPLECDRS